MPCRDPEPTDRDRRADEVCELIIILCKKMNMPVPESVPDGYARYYGGDKLDFLTDILCGSIRALSQQEVEEIVYGRNRDSRRLANWWDDHQEADKKDGI